MCLPELLMDVVIIKGDTDKLSVVAVSCQIHVTGCDVMLSCHVIGLLIADVAVKTEHSGLDCMAKMRSEEELQRLTESPMKTAN